MRVLRTKVKLQYKRRKSTTHTLLLFLYTFSQSSKETSKWLHELACLTHLVLCWSLAVLRHCNCWLITDKTSTFILLNSSKQHQIPDWLKPEKYLPMICACNNSTKWRHIFSVHGLSTLYVPYNLELLNNWWQYKIYPVPEINKIK